MEFKQLYNIETDILITLHRKGMILEVRSAFTQTHRLDKLNFTILFLLAISHPYMVSYEEIIQVLEAVNINTIQKHKDVDSKISNLKKDLHKLGIKNLVIKYKKIGFAISNKWIEPGQINTNPTDRKFLQYFKRLWGLAAKAIK